MLSCYRKFHPTQHSFPAEGGGAGTAGRTQPAVRVASVWTERGPGQKLSCPLQGPIPWWRGTLLGS